MIPAAKPIIGDDERAAVDLVLRSGMVAQGPEVAAFEDDEVVEALLREPDGGTEPGEPRPHHQDVDDFRLIHSLSLTTNV